MRMRYFGLALLAMAAFANGQQTSKRPLPAVKVGASPVIDGKLDDDIWKKIPELTNFYDNQNDKLVSDQTIVRIGYDQKFIYVAFEMIDADPSQVSATETQEDSRFNTDTPNEDVVDVRLDPFNTNTFGGSSVFSVNAIGTRSVSIGGGRAKKLEWKGDWKAAATRTARGWTAEMQIPWAMLNYKHRKGPQNMGINFFRYQRRLKQPSFWSNVGPNTREELQGIWTGVETPPPPKPKLSVLPYVIGGIDDKSRPIFKSGLDAKYSINSDTTAVASINPDFGTVEGAVDSISYTRTERFLPERRPFFLEGSSFFRTGMGFDIGSFFYPRRIDGFDFGTKVFGKVTQQDSVGILQTITFGKRLDAVINWNHQVSPYESYGFFANSKNSGGDNANVMTANYSKEFGKVSFSTRYAQSNDNGVNALSSSNSVMYQDKNNFMFISYTDINDKFRLADGLLGFKGYRGWDLYDQVSHEWRTGPFQSNQTEFDLVENKTLEGKPFQRGMSVSNDLIFRNDVGFKLNASCYDFAGDVDRDYSAQVTFGANNRFSRYYLSTGGGTIANDPTRYAGGGFSQRIGKGLDISLSHFFQNYQGSNQQNIFTFGYEVNPHRSFGGRFVSEGDKTNWYLSFREAGRKGTEWYVVLGNPNSQTFQHMLQIKAVFAF